MRAQEPFGTLQGRRDQEERYTLGRGGKAERRFSYLHNNGAVNGSCGGNGNGRLGLATVGKRLARHCSRSLARRTAPAEAAEPPYLPTSQKTDPTSEQTSEAHCLRPRQYAVKDLAPRHRRPQPSGVAARRIPHA